MRQTDLIQHIADKQTGLSLQDVSVSVDRLLTYISDELSKDRRIEIRNFGNFTLKYYQARKVRNPKTGDQKIAPGGHKVHFKPGKQLCDLMKKMN